MICSIIISLLFLIPVQCFYMTNAGALEQCPTGTNNYVPMFQSNKMRCINTALRHVTMALDYICINNILTHTWRIQTVTNQGSPWPQTVSFYTDSGYSKAGQTVNQQTLIVEEISKTFNPSSNQLMTHMWTTLSNGPQCRMKYVIAKDICTTNKGKKLGSILTDFICYYGNQKFNFTIATQRNAFNKFINDNIKPGSSKPQNGFNRTHDGSNFSALGSGASAFWETNKRFIYIGGGIGLGIILVAIIIIAIRCRSSSNEQFETRVSVASTTE